MRQAMQHLWRWCLGERTDASEAATGRITIPPEVQIPASCYERFGTPIHLNYPSTTLGRLLDQTARRYASAPAVSYGALRWTYAELRQRVDRLAAGLAHIGARRGERVLLALPNCPEMMLAFLAAQRIGAVVVNAGPLMGPDDLKKLMSMTQPRVAIGLDVRADTLGPAGADRDDLHWIWVSLRDHLPLLDRMGYRLKQWQSHPDLPETQKQTTLEELLEQAPSRPPSEEPSVDDIAVLQPTGGTTGTLKVAKLTHRSLLANAAQVSAWTRLRLGQERVLGILPMFHVYGLSTCLINPVFHAAEVIPVTRFKIDQLIETLLTLRPTVVPLVPAIFDAICEQAEADPALSRQLAQTFSHRLIISGAAALSPTTAHRFEMLFGEKIAQGYGLTEASPVTHLNPPQEPRDGSIGVPLPDTFTRVVDLQNPERTATSGEAGELWISGPQVMLGYLDNETATQEMMVTDAKGRRWLRTGDVVTVDEEGFYYVVDRKKDMINRGGMKVWPAKVETVLRRHTAVRDVAVIGRPDAKYEETVVGVIVLGNGREDYDALATELRALCREHLAPYEVPSRFEFVDELPRSGLGKMLKYQLRESNTTRAADDKEMA